MKFLISDLHDAAVTMEQLEKDLKVIEELLVGILQEDNADKKDQYIQHLIIKIGRTKKLISNWETE